MLVNKERLLQASDPVRCPASSSAPAHTSPKFHQERGNASFVLNSLRTLFPARNLQPSHSHKLAHSFTHNKNVTAAFTITSPLFLRSFAQERKLTHLFSCIPALFREKWGCGRKPGPQERKSPVRGAFAVDKCAQNSDRLLTVNFLYHFPFQNNSEIGNFRRKQLRDDRPARSLTLTTDRVIPLLLASLKI
jgi:hypothetical protein